MDTIADFLTKVRNASMAGHEKVDIPNSNLRSGIATILRDTGYIRNFKVVRDHRQGVMRIYLKYTEEGKPAFSAIDRVSRPGRRVYVGTNEIPKVRSGYGLAILSTSQGVLSGDQATSKNLGGELLCTIW
jgi:small subunit ribosomal protein S8